VRADHTTQDRSEDAREDEDARDDAHEFAVFLRGDQIRRYDHDHRVHSGSTDTLKRAEHDPVGTPLGEERENEG
jgi:hypothetical protein